ncbi:hypothetical protein Z043_116316 [Scleropages formosus]|uniref:Uncharacterized protein n=1 Tax=Scleropages formosus TaxID=113540 RepID=A0A0P7UYS2_SCLFO|nr:hypothetical protein Z043_116316 [Scleropages formosus]
MRTGHGLWEVSTPSTATTLRNLSDLTGQHLIGEAPASEVVSPGMRSGKKLCASHPGRTPCPSKMPDSLCGTWDMVRLLFAACPHGTSSSDGICPMLCKLALKVKQRKVVEQRGDVYVVKTLSSLRNHSLSFRVNEEFEEFTKGLDERHCKPGRLMI